MKELIPNDKIESKIYYLRGQKIMFDHDLAQLYEVETKVLNQSVKRNIERFPEDFMFQLNKVEYDILISQNVISNLRSQNATTKRGGSRTLPYAFTEQGVAMLSSVLKSKRAIDINIAIMRTFVNIRKFVSSYDGLARQIAEMEKKYDKKISTIMGVIDKLLADDKKIKAGEIGFKAV
jgi:hypothetical protein